MTNNSGAGRKKALLYKMLHPGADASQNFNDADFLELVHLGGEEAVTFDDLRDNIRHIYDMNESSLLRISDAMQGGLAWLNRQKQKQRRNRFFERIREGHRTGDYKTVVAEGDSWFCFPFYVKDINEWLLDDDRINLYSVAAAGDWITNMIYEGKYVEELSMIEPEVFLISGGGNDFCGNYRLSFMINNKVDQTLDGDDYIKACVSGAFNAFVWTLKTQYWILLTSLNKARKLEGLKVITHGYDYVLPFPKMRRGPDLIQWIINKATDTGDWLRTPLMLKGMVDIKKQVAVMAHFIDKVNEMFIWLATYRNPETNQFQFPNLYHIDCRLVAGGFEGWFDEIHLKSEKFKIVAEAYKHVIFEQPQNGSSFQRNRKVVEARHFATEGNIPLSS